MKPIPAEAMPVVEIIRREVPRPSVLPVRLKETLRWKINNDYYCPMGLCPKALRPVPMGPFSFGYDESRSTGSASPFLHTDAFMCWWDRLLEKDAAEAVDAIWLKGSN
jgi:hypothetical protein